MQDAGVSIPIQRFCQHKMKKNNLLILILLIVLTGAGQMASAQFPLKLPKIGKPKAEQSKPEQTPIPPPSKADANPSAPSDANQNTSRSAQPSKNQPNLLDDPERPKVPQILLETLEIKAHNQAKYWKTPANNDNPSWFPQVSFDVFYAAGSPTLRYVADWTNPDGSLWFSEPLEMNYGNDFPDLRSPYESKDIEPKAVVATGTYGLKITDSKTSQIIFQGKFKVSKMPLAPPTDHKLLFYVENDWTMPIGFVGFKLHWTDYNVHTRPIVFFWFKGTPDSGQMEAELYYNNQRIATTDKGGNAGIRSEERGADCYEARQVCAHKLLGFEWNNFVINNSSAARQNNPNAWFTNDHPGEYTVKVFYNGDQVRETKFTIQPNGWLAPNAYAAQIPMDGWKIVVPVKVMGTLDKWNPAAWKTDAFYGNPLTGFVAP